MLRLVSVFTHAGFALVGITSSLAIAESPRCRVGQFWPKVGDDILQTV